MSDDLNFLNILGSFGDADKTLTLEAGAILFSKGDRASEMYIVKSGQIEIVNDGLVYEVISAGGIFGEMALALDTRRTAAARAVTKSEVLPINEDRFLSLVQHNPFFAIRVIRLMCERLLRADKRADRPYP
ncbi:MAG TPA: cyclic nucleotide-binding domain-containing protein [Alphaproteobacteria bacterium]|nr:cyclic nucleotide-binding domain-containing protein [Alphaproteobacteria bacterium]